MSSSLPLVHGNSRVCLDNIRANPGLDDSRCQGNGLASHTASDSVSIASGSDMHVASVHIEPHARTSPVVDQSTWVDSTKLEATSDNLKMSTHGAAGSLQEPALDSTVPSSSSSLGGHDAPILEPLPEVVARPEDVKNGGSRENVGI
ncbi:hypothetical protein V6N12_054051 [Hibiscus sabdariffa]|uniref:Uncharacterized protein n=1 Tax=Hibiscus sabdariffa TaxID=183260 RepID=A0ABR2DAA3_9ROSI